MATANKTAKTFINVDGKEVLLTNAVMMQLAIEALEEVDASAVVIEKAKNHLASLTRKTSTTAGQPTKAQIENARYAQTLLGIMPDGEPVTLEWVAGKLGLVGTDGKGNKQKAQQVMKVLVAASKVVKIDGRPVQYQLV